MFVFHLVFDVCFSNRVPGSPRERNENRQTKDKGRSSPMPAEHDGELESASFRNRRESVTSVTSFIVTRQ